MGYAPHVDELFLFSDWRFELIDWLSLTKFDHAIDPKDARYLKPFERYK